jgi:hypothetical protein
MVIRANSFFASTNPSSRLLSDAASSACRAAASFWTPLPPPGRAAASAWTPSLHPGRCSPSTAGAAAAPPGRYSRCRPPQADTAGRFSSRRPLPSLQPRLRAATAAAGRRRWTPPAPTIAAAAPPGCHVRVRPPQADTAGRCNSRPPPSTGSSPGRL